MDADATGKFLLTHWEGGAHVISLSPGLITTKQGALVFQNSAGTQRIFQLSPLKREDTRQEIAGAVEFLASSRASFFSGKDLRVDGGLGAALSSN